MRGYTAVARQDRDDGWGVTLTYVRNDLLGKVISHENHSVGRVKLCTLRIRNHRGILTISNVYAAPGWLRSDRGWLNLVPDDAILLGDMNSTGSWDSATDFYTSRPTDRFLEEQLFERGFIVLNDGSPTHTSPHASSTPSAIDVTADPPQWARLCSWKADSEPTNDHHNIVLTIDLKLAGHTACRRRWALSKADWAKYRAEIDRYLRTRNLDVASLEVLNRTLTHAIITAAKKSIPKGRRPKEGPWWNEDVDVSIEQRKQAWRVFLRDKTPETYDALVRQRAETDATIRHEKRASWRDIISRVSPRSSDTLLWRILKGMDKRGTPFCPKTLRGCEHASDTRKADTFLQNFIASIKLQSKERIHCNAYRSEMDKARRLVETRCAERFSASELNHVIQHMNARRTGGPDDVQVSFLKELSPTATRVLLELFNRSYAEGATPSAWRVAEMILIEKPGKRFQFRPISLTNVIARCMERLVLSRFQPWAEQILPQQQAGFRQYRSCEEQIAGLTEDISQAMYERKVRIALFLDYSGAYDRVSIKCLLAKLGRQGCAPQLLLWLRAFLVDRRAYCRWGASKGPVRVLPNGLPQGSSFSCLLWDLYILDLPSSITGGKVSLFADDTSVWAVGNSYQECKHTIEVCIHEIEGYCRAHHICINPQKTVLLPFGNRTWGEQNLSITVAGHDVSPCSAARFLGVIIDTKLSFNPHAKNVSAKLLRRCKLLACLSGRSWGADEQTLQLTRKAFLEPIAQYACAAWVPHASDSALTTIERARNVALRLQTGCCRPTLVDSLRELTHTPSLRDEAIKAAAILLEKTARLWLAQNLLDNRGTRKKCRFHRRTAKEYGECRLAELGILPLPRLSLPNAVEVARYRSPLSKINFHYTDCSQSDNDATRQRKAHELLARLDHCDVEI